MKITQEVFYKTLKNGSYFPADRIQDEINHLLETKNYRWTDHSFQRDHDEGYWYIYDNECYLFVFDDKIIVRCDRDAVNSAGQCMTVHIKNKQDIERCYETFRSMTMEDDE